MHDEDGAEIREPERELTLCEELTPEARLISRFACLDGVKLLKGWVFVWGTPLFGLWTLEECSVLCQDIERLETYRGYSFHGAALRSQHSQVADSKCMWQV